MHSIAAAAIRTITSWDAQALANTAWSCAAIAFRNSPLLQSISEASIIKIAELKSQELSNTAWAFATMELRHWPLMDAIASASLRLLQHFDSQGMSNPAWAFAQLACQHAPLMDSISSAALRLIPEGNQQELANFSWSNWAILVPKPFLLKRTLPGFSRLHALEPDTGGRIVGVEWIHMADCAATRDDDGHCRLLVAVESFSSPPDLAGSPFPSCAPHRAHCPTWFQRIEDILSRGDDLS